MRAVIPWLWEQFTLQPARFRYVISKSGMREHLSCNGQLS